MLLEPVVYKYKTSGKLVVQLDQGYWYDLTSRMNFSSSPPHRINRKTEIIATKWTLEVEKNNGEYLIVRAFERVVKPIVVKESSGPLEDRVNISPSKYLTKAEKQYINPEKYKLNSKHQTHLTLLWISVFFLFILYFTKHWYAALAVHMSLALLYWHSRPPADDPLRISEVENAKERARQKRTNEFDSLVADFFNWERLDGKAFEIAVAKLFEMQGWTVKLTPDTNDGGIDLIMKNNEEEACVQCKAFSSNVGVSTARELHGIKNQWPQANRFIIVALNGFTKPAIDFSKDHSIELFSIKYDHFGLV